MKIAAVQCDIRLGDLAVNIQSVTDRLSTTLSRSVDLTVFPECMLTGYAFEDRDEAMAAAIPLEHEIFRTIAGKIRQSGNPTASVTLGSLILVDQKLFNAAILISGDGIVGHYRKVHLPQLGVDRFVDRGDQAYRVHQVGELNVGMAICYDCSFPEPMRVLGLAGADVVALGTNWPVAAERTAEVVPPARSMENHYYFVAANRVGTERGFTFCGRSSICGPDGLILAASPDDSETILYGDINLTIARNKRIERSVDAHVIDRMADRQPKFYTPITE